MREMPTKFVTTFYGPSDNLLGPYEGPLCPVATIRIGSGRFLGHLMYMEPSMMLIEHREVGRRRFRIANPHCYFLVWHYIRNSCITYDSAIAMVAKGKLRTMNDSIGILPFPNVTRSTGVVCSKFHSHQEMNLEDETWTSMLHKSCRRAVLDFWGSPFSDAYIYSHLHHTGIPDEIRPNLIYGEDPVIGSFFVKLQKLSREGGPEAVASLDWNTPYKLCEKMVLE